MHEISDEDDGRTIEQVIAELPDRLRETRVADWIDADEQPPADYGFGDDGMWRQATADSRRAVAGRAWADEHGAGYDWFQISQAVARDGMEPLPPQTIREL
jgi:hypothetical protein